MFVRDMSASRGYIAIAIAILSRYNCLLYTSIVFVRQPLRIHCEDA